MTIFDLGTLTRIPLPPLPPELLTAVVSTPPARHTCPHCRRPVAGLLAGCNRPACLSAEIAADIAFDRSLDL